MITLGQNQTKVLNAIKAVEGITFPQLVETTGIRENKVQVIVAEFLQAGLIKMTPEKVISYREDQLAPRRYVENGGDTDEWENYRPAPKLKNLSRLV